MNTFQINKILGLVLGTLLFLQAVHIVDASFAPAKVAKPGSEVAVKEQPAGGAAGVPIENLLASASVDRGAQTAKQCGICHNFQEGQGPKIGPDLYGVVGRAVASVPAFNYSAPLKAKGGTWTFNALNKWLTKPSADVPGTAMTFAGLPNEKQRADVIAYLNTLSAKPLPLPTAQNAAAPAANAPAAAPASASAAPPAAAPGNPPASAAAPAAPGGAAPAQH